MIVNNEFVKEYIIEMIKLNEDKFHPEDTSVSQVSMPIKRLVKMYPNQDDFSIGGEINLDYGGGKYDKGTEYLKLWGITNLVYDKYARTPEHNAKVLKILKKRKVDSITLANVLCVIPDLNDRLFVVSDAFKYLKINGWMLISVYEGDKSGNGKIIAKPDRMHWQEHRNTKTYISEIKDALKPYNIDIIYKNKLIIVKKLGLNES